jgi:hypothetical protein
MVFDIDDPTGEKIRIHMRRPTFDDLAERIVRAQFDANRRARDR